MKILYGVQGTGNGHITRARALSKAFNQANIKVDYLFSGRDRDNFFDMEPFGEWQCKKGLTFIHKAGHLSIPKTLAHNSVKTLLSDIKSLDLRDYDLVLTDFEPITAWAAKKQNVASIGVGHQYAFYNNVPRRGDNIASRMIMRHFAPANIQLGLHWHHFNQPILPPIAEVHISQLAAEKNKIIVYLGFESHDDVMRLLEPFKNYLFVVYGPYEKYQNYDHIQLKPLSREGFQRDLSNATGVICNAGFELASEAIQLGKKLLVKPLQGQMEQLSNARALEELSLGMTMNSLSQETVTNWLNCSHAKQVIYPDVAGEIVKWIQEEYGTWHNTKKLSEKLWGQVKTFHTTRDLAKHDEEFAIKNESLQPI